MLPLMFATARRLRTQTSQRIDQLDIQRGSARDGADGVAGGVVGDSDVVDGA